MSDNEFDAFVDKLQDEVFTDAKNALGEKGCERWKNRSIQKNLTAGGKNMQQRDSSGSDNGDLNNKSQGKQDKSQGKCPGSNSGRGKGRGGGVGRREGTGGGKGRGGGGKGEIKAHF